MLLLSTIALRPYVFIFLLVYLVGCTMQFGLKRTLTFGVIGYCIAWLSELSSIHNGFPYGSYFYIEQTRGQEVWVLGVPLMDSISYVFLTYASYSLAIMVLSPMRKAGWLPYVLETAEIRHSWYTAVLSSLLMVYLDIIIDPVALQGHKWFLGQIYGYGSPGVYFGVPLSNFIGWFFVGVIMVRALQKIDQWFLERDIQDYNGHKYPLRYLIGPGLYAGVVVFNLAITFFIKEYHMGCVGVFIALLPACLMITLWKIRLSAEDKKAVDQHLHDFPKALVL